MFSSLLLLLVSLVQGVLVALSRGLLSLQSLNISLNISARVVDVNRLGRVSIIESGE